MSALSLSRQAPRAIVSKIFEEARVGCGGFGALLILAGPPPIAGEPLFQQLPALVQRVAQVFCGGEQFGATERAPGISQREQHERLIVEVGARVEHLALVVETMDVEPVAAAAALEEEIDVGVNHLPPRTGPAQPAELATREGVAGLHEQAMRTGIPFAMDRHAFGKERCFAVGLRPPEMSGRPEQPVPRMRGDVLEGPRPRAMWRVW